MIQRRTQLPAYWEEAFVIDEADLEHISNLFLEDETPLSTEELALAIVKRRTRQEELALERLLSRGTLYQPKQAFEVGQEIVFPVLGFTVGRVVARRPGNNPEYGSFEVVTVDFEGGRRQREFAASLNIAHRLNAEGAEGSAEGGAAQEGLLPAEELYDRYGHSVGEKLEARLAALPDFVRLAGKWFLRSLLADVNPGHLNIAEAILDMNGGGPLPSEALLRDLDLPAEINHNLQVFSLNYALQRDERFDEVGPTGEVLWFLRRLEPAEVIDAPRQLVPNLEAYDAGHLTADELALVRELDDEWEPPVEGEGTAERARPAEASFVLTFPHRRAGTLPLSRTLAPIFPTARIAPRVRFTLIDGQTGERYPAWVVRPQRYACGLAPMYQKYEIPAGATLTVRPGDEPGTVVFEHGARRPKREWVRVAGLTDGAVTFEMQKRLISVGYDEQTIMWVDDPASFDPLWPRGREQGRALTRVVDNLFLELAKLNAQSTVHAKTLYGAVNLMRRSTAGPILAVLHANPAYVTVGGNYWRYDESRAA